MQTSSFKKISFIISCLCCHGHHCHDNHCCHYWHQLQLYAFPFAFESWFLHSSWRGLFVPIHRSIDMSVSYQCSENCYTCFENLHECCWCANGLISGGSSTADCMWSDKLKSSLEKQNFWFFSSSFFTFDFKICLYVRCFDTSYCPHDIFWLHFANSSKLWENKMCQWTSFKFSAIKLFSQSFFENWQGVVKICHVDNARYQNF